MRYYYIVDSLKMLKQAHKDGHCKQWEAVGTTHPNINDAANPDFGVGNDAQVVAAVRFRDHGQMDSFEALPFVHPMGDPLDADELPDAHMITLSRFHPFVLKAKANDPLGAAAPKVWHDSTTDTPITAKPHLRKMMTQYVGKAFPNLRFRIFG